MLQVGLVLRLQLQSLQRGGSRPEGRMRLEEEVRVDKRTKGCGRGGKSGVREREHARGGEQAKKAEEEGRGQER